MHDADYRALEGEPDDDVGAAAIADDRALVTENVGDLRRIEADALLSTPPETTTTLVLKPATAR
ncbi:MAG: hypothetical protein ACYDHH_12170 [Solirubrobacteraceae bacterium]